jgi:hypothetical protein
MLVSHNLTVETRTQLDIDPENDGNSKKNLFIFAIHCRIIVVVNLLLA